MTTGKAIALTRGTFVGKVMSFVGKVMSLLFNAYGISIIMELCYAYGIMENAYGNSKSKSSFLQEQLENLLHLISRL